MKKQNFVYISCIICVVLVKSTQGFINKPNITYVPKLIQSHGYPVEVHEVITEDGYVIEMHRIPHGVRNKTSKNEKKKVIILSHCIFCSSSVFVILGPSKALAYILAENGYDVWLLNSRGTKASRKHVKWSHQQSEYWKFSWSEQGLYDVSAVIDYTLKLSGQPQIDYIGFSMGNAQIFSMLSERPEYNSKIRTVISMAPAIFMNSTLGFFPVKPPMSDIFLHNGVKSGDLQFPPKSVSKELRNLLGGACNPVLKPMLNWLCHFAFKLMGGNINGNVEDDSLFYYFKYFPDTISLRAMIHYTQLRFSARFEKYNFGRRMNKKMYGSSRPPSFDLKKATVPVNIIYSYGDTVTNYKDVERFTSNLPNVVDVYTIPFRNFSHMDFIWGNNAPEQVYGKILERLSADYS